MSFQQEHSEHLNTITACEHHEIRINHISYPNSMVISPETLQPVRISTISDIDSHILSQITAMQPEVILIGTGNQHQFVPSHQLAPLYEAQIGVECMSSAAAARTYNVLMNEGRKVVALIIINTQNQQV